MHKLITRLGESGGLSDLAVMGMKYPQNLYDLRTGSCQGKRSISSL